MLTLVFAKNDIDYKCFNRDGFAKGEWPIKVGCLLAVFLHLVFFVVRFQLAVGRCK